MTRSTIFASLVVSMAFAGPTLAFELDHSAGTLTLPQTPQRVVSFDLGHLDTLTTLGVPVVGVPKSVYSGSLERYSKTPVVGTLFEPDYDALKQQSPDLIIAGGRSAAAMPQLGDVAPTVSFSHDPNHFMESQKDASSSMGRAWGKETEAKQAYDAVQANVDTLQKINQGKRGALLFVINDNVMAHAPGDRFGYAYELTGLESVLPPRNADEVAKPRPKPGTPEAEAAAAQRARDISSIAKADPDWLIILDRGAINDGEKTAAQTLAKHPELSQTTAFKENKVYYADPNGWYVVTGGLSNLKVITDDLIETIQN